MKKTIAVVLILLVVSGTLVLAKNAVARMAVSGGVRAMTGLSLKMRRMNVGIFRSLIGIEELKILNPVGFPDRVMADVPEIYIDYNLGAFLKGKVHLEEVRFHLSEFTVVKNEKGDVNLDSLKVVKVKKEEQVSPTKAKREKAKMPKLQIDRLELTIGKVVYKDYSRGLPPKVSEFNVNIHERYENITNPYAFASLIVSRALFKTTIARLTNFDLEMLETEVTGVLRKYTGTLTETVTKAAGTTKGVGEGAVGSAKEAAEETAEALKKLFPFGKE